MKLVLDKNGVFADLNFEDLVDACDYNKYIPRTTGVYALLNENKEVIYIGKSVCLKKRIYQHMEKKGGGRDKEKIEKIKEETKYITYCEIPLSIEVDIYETLLIDYFKPIYNIDKLYLSKNNNGHSKSLNKSKENFQEKIKLIEIEKRKVEREKLKQIINNKRKDDFLQFDPDLKIFLIEFFKINKGVNVSIQTLKMICENNGYETNVIGTCYNLTQLKELGIVFKKGYFICE